MFAEPVLHEFGAFFHYADLNLYLATVNHFIEAVEDPYNHFIELGSRPFKFFSKPGGLINPKTGKVAFEYILSWKDDIKASKCAFTIKPLFGPGTKTKTGKTLNLPLIGTQVQVQSSFIELHELRDLFDAFMLHIDAGRFIPMLDMKLSRIYDAAMHVRYHERHEPAVIRMLQAIEDENNTMGDVAVNKDKKNGKWNMFYLNEPDLSVCDIHPKWVHGIKSYRIKEFKKRPETDPLRHPKFEVFLHKDDEMPTLEQYLELKGDIDNTLIKLLSLVSPIEYVSDRYFDADKNYEYRGVLPEWDSENIPKPNPDDYALWDHPKKSLSVLAYIANEPEGCTQFRSIMESLDIPKSTLWRHINHWINEGILERKRKECTYIFFSSASLWRAIKEPVLQVCSFLKIGFKRLWGQAIINSGIIKTLRKSKENKTQKKPAKVTSDKKQHIVVDDWRKAKELRKELNDDGVGHLFNIGIVSNKSNMRYSRTIG